MCVRIECAHSKCKTCSVRFRMKIKNTIKNSNQFKREWKWIKICNFSNMIFQNDEKRTIRYDAYDGDFYLDICLVCIKKKIDASTMCNLLQTHTQDT